MYGGIILHGYIRRYLRQQPYDDDNGNFRSSSVIYSVPFPVGTAKFSFCFYGYNYIIIRYILCTDNEVVADARTHAGICGMCGCLPQSVVRVALKMFAKKKKKETRGRRRSRRYASVVPGRRRSRREGRRLQRTFAYIPLFTLTLPPNRTGTHCRWNQ